jgi:hypothetical protein
VTHNEHITVFPPGIVEEVFFFVLSDVWLFLFALCHYYLLLYYCRSTLCFLLRWEKFLVINVRVKLLQLGGSSVLNGK